MSRRRTLEKRVDHIHFMDPDESKVRAESAASQAWIVVHLTEEEQVEGARALKAEKHDKVNNLMRVGMDRAANESTEAKEEFVKKYVRAEVIRSRHRHLTEAESDELHALNSWLQARNHWSERKQCLVGLSEE